MPAKPQATRKLSAILSADVKGFTLLMSDNESATIETLKAYLVKNDQTTFTAFEVRRKLKVKKTTQWRYHKQLLENYYIKKRKAKGENITRYELTNPNEYIELQAEITRALQECLTNINRSSIPERSTTKMERITKRKTAS